MLKLFKTQWPTFRSQSSVRQSINVRHQILDRRPKWLCLTSKPLKSWITTEYSRLSLRWTSRGSHLQCLGRRVQTLSTGLKKGSPYPYRHETSQWTISRLMPIQETQECCPRLCSQHGKLRVLSSRQEMATRIHPRDTSRALSTTPRGKFPR